MTVDEVTADVPAELVGRESTTKLLVPIFHAASRHRIPLGELFEGVPESLDHLRDEGVRFAWTSYMRIMQNLGRRLSEEELVDIGATYLQVPAHRAFLLPYRLLFSLPEVYLRGCGPESSMARQIVVQEMSVTIAGEHRLFFETRMKRGYTAVPAYWHVRRGFVESVPLAFGLPRARATMEASPHGARYDVFLPEASGLADRVRRSTSWLFAARDMASALRKANEDLLERNLELEREVSARRRAEEKLLALNQDLERRIQERTSALEHANRDLAAVNEELSTFSASIAHDLRTPLRGINGFATTVLEDYGAQLGEDARAQLGRIITGAVRMGELIDALLALSRVTRAELKVERLDLTQLVRSVVDELALREADRYVHVVIAEDMSAEADAALTRSMLEQLLANAWKFTRGRERARVEVGPVAGATVPTFYVRDNGVGFDMQHARRLFAPFVRVHPQAMNQGCGVGLAIVDRIVRRHGGQVRVEAAPEQGATFSFSLRPSPAAE